MPCVTAKALKKKHPISKVGLAAVYPLQWKVTQKKGGDGVIPDPYLHEIISLMTANGKALAMVRPSLFSGEDTKFYWGLLTTRGQVRTSGYALDEKTAMLCAVMALLNDVGRFN